jgi:hypothetical protein
LFVGLSGHGFELANELLGHSCGACGNIRGHGGFGSIRAAQLRQDRGNGGGGLARKVGHPHLESFR